MSPEARALIERRYFDLYAKEDIGKTPQLTEELDHIEEVLKCSRSVAESSACLGLPCAEQNGSTAQTATPSQKLLTNGDGKAPGHCKLRGRNDG